MDAQKIESLLSEICQKIGGDWLLVGGSLVHLEYDGARATEDIDLISITHPSYSEAKSQDELFKSAFSLGMDPESVNSAAKFFIGQIKGWESEVCILRTGPVGRVFKPNLTLFVLLKIARGTGIDLSDIDSAVKKEGAETFLPVRFREIASPGTWEKFEVLRARWGI